MNRQAKDWTEFNIKDSAWMNARTENKPFRVIMWSEIGNKKFVEYRMEDHGIELVMTPVQAVEVKRERQRQKNAADKLWLELYGR